MFVARGFIICCTLDSPAGRMAVRISACAAREIITTDPATAASLVGVSAVFDGVGQPLFCVSTGQLSAATAEPIFFVLILACSLDLSMAGPGSAMLSTRCLSGFWLVPGV